MGGGYWVFGIELVEDVVDGCCWDFEVVEV